MRDAPWPGAVAVSGGGDSLALMHLLAAWAKKTRRAAPVVLTVDHGLQQGSKANARKVVRWANAAGMKAHVLTWSGIKPKSDIEAAARAARYRLMAEWCEARGIDALYAGHTRDDQAETFLLRLARGSGLDGLAAMRRIADYPLAEHPRIALVRPLIGLEREALRAHLTRRKQAWLDDPMNADPRFARVRVREAMTALGLSAARVASAAAHLARAREALDAVTDAVLRRACRREEGVLLVDTKALCAAPREIGLRALARILMGAGGHPYRPRFEALERLFDRIAADSLGKGCTLHGCKIAAAGPGRLSVSPELRRKPLAQQALNRV